MSKHSATRSQAGALTAAEIRSFNNKLVARAKVLHKHPVIVRGLLKKPKRIDSALLSLVPPQDPFVAARKQWESFYLKHFGLTVDLSKVAIPAQKEGFSRLIIVAQGVTLNTAMAACRKKFPCWQYADDLDASVTKNDRTAQGGAYAVWFRDRIEADEETANKSANDLAAEQVPGITLFERILMELDYHDRTGDHLDKQNVTLCSGSRYRDGSVPRCDWFDGKFYVIWYSPRDAYQHLRARVVS